MRMAKNQLFTDAVADVIKRKCALFRFHLRMEHHLKQNVAEFFQKQRCVTVVNRLDNLIGFLNKIPPDTLVGLFPVPGTAAFPAEDAHDLKQVADPVVFLKFKIHLKPPTFNSLKTHVSILPHQFHFFKYFYYFFPARDHLKVASLNRLDTNRNNYIQKRGNPHSQGH